MMQDRADLATGFLQRVGWGSAARQHLAGDASDRRYERLHLSGQSAVLMDAPPGQADDPAAFVLIANHLLKLGLSAPAILAQDLTQGFLLLEDLGDALYARVISDDAQMEEPFYLAATRVLTRLQAAAPPPGMANLSAADWAEAAAMALDWYRRAITGDKGDRAGFVSVLRSTLETLADGPRVLILRDYHAENLLWLPGRQGLARVGLLDFQLAQMGQPAYDLVSLLQDARRDVGRDTIDAARQAFLAETGQSETDFTAAYAALGAQRALRILGIFARLCMRDAKPGYLRLVPRVWAQLQENLAHPALAALARVCEAELPPPSEARLKRMEDQCPHLTR